MVIKKYFFKLFTVCSLFLGLLALTTSAEAKREFSVADLKLLSTFLSNFTELRMFDFDQALISNDTLISFGIQHNVINNRSRIVRCKDKDCSYGPLAIEAKFVSESIKKYFGKDFNNHASVKPDFNYYKEYLYYYDGQLYHFDGSDGESTYYAHVIEARENESGEVILTGELYNVENHDDILGKFEAKAKPYKFGGKNTWSILSLKSEIGND